METPSLPHRHVNANVNINVNVTASVTAEHHSPDPPSGDRTRHVLVSLLNAARCILQPMPHN